MREALDIRVTGIVQGVGFRPFVYKLARRYVIAGWVLNDAHGVFIHAEGETKLLDEFVAELHENPPVAAHVRTVELKEVPLQDCEKFEIRASEEQAGAAQPGGQPSGASGNVQEDAAENKPERTLVSTDLGVCDDCLAEMMSPSNRRYRYPFINCTNCGPRFTIIRDLPYDRASTSMEPFAMCPDCAHEYEDPMDRRFHAQPDACFECGPHISWAPAQDDGTFAAPIWGDTREASDAILARAVQLLARGGILAVKGLGGFHLVCDALNAEALERLRAGKQRDGKAFAVMVENADAAARVCHVSSAEAKLLKTPARPIVLLLRCADAQLPVALAGILPELGVMLPATPLQHLLISDFREATGREMLVMTSGNVHNQPIVIDDAEAYGAFAGIADAVLGNNRQILARYDDSVVRVLDLGLSDALQMIRRARGYAPVPIAFPHAGNSAAGELFAAGPQQKNTFAFVRDGKAYVSQHIGDFEDARTFDAWLDARNTFLRLFRFAPNAIACDAHPSYTASMWARERAEREGISCTEVQHHHAHIASVLGEHGLEGPVCGIAFDGTGAGPDGAVWGGEVLLANRADYERFANFAYVPMPGGAAAVRHPLRMAYGVLWAYDLLEHPEARALFDVPERLQETSLMERIIEQNINTPHTSSVGRLFDAAAALLGVCGESSYEGEAAILLDAVRASADADPDLGDARTRYAVAVSKNAATSESTAHDTSVLLLDASPVFAALLDDKAAGVPVPVISLRFHEALIDTVIACAHLAYNLYGIDTVALSGGVFMNRYIVQECAKRLGAAGFKVALNADLPPNDGCISYGQAVVAAASR